MKALDSINGYCIVFGARGFPQTHDNVPHIIEAGAPRWLRSAVTANYAHHENLVFARGSERTLRLWSDAVGVAFEASIPATPEGAGLRSMLASGTWGASPLVVFHGRVFRNNGGERVAHVTSCNIEHVSIAADPAFPDTAVWLASSTPEQLLPHVRQMRGRWHAGIQATAKKAVRARASLRPTPMPIPGQESRMDFLYALAGIVPRRAPS